MTREYADALAALFDGESVDPATMPPVTAAPSSVGEPVGHGPQVAVAPTDSPSIGPNALAGGPPPATLRLRFSHWQTPGARAAGQPE